MGLANMVAMVEVIRYMNHVVQGNSVSFNQIDWYRGVLLKLVRNEVKSTKNIKLVKTAFRSGYRTVCNWSDFEVYMKSHLLVAFVVGHHWFIFSQ